MLRSCRASSSSLVEPARHALSVEHLSRRSFSTGKFKLQQAQAARSSTNITHQPRAGPRYDRSLPSSGRQDRLSKLLLELAFERKSRKPTPETLVNLLRETLSYIRRFENDSNILSTPLRHSTPLSVELVMAVVRCAATSHIDLGFEGRELLHEIAVFHPELLPSLLVTAFETDHYPASLISALIKMPTPTPSLSQHIFVLCESLKRGYAVSPSLLRDTMEACCTWGNPRLALQLAAVGGQTPAHAKEIDAAMREEILVASAETGFMEGLEIAWTHASSTGVFAPDEGLILRIIDVAARNSRPDMAENALKYLDSLPVKVEPRHLLPLVEAHLNNGSVLAAVKVAASLPQDDDLKLDDLAPLIRHISDSEIIDKVFYHLEDLHRTGERLNVVSVNALIAAAVRLNDLHRARAIQSSFEDLGVTPNMDTFNLLLKGCVTMEHRALGDNIMSEISKAGLSPTQSTYEDMIALCLIPREYEDAFYYLEQMKSLNLMPSREIYRRLLEKCQRNNDHRGQFVLEEMETLGYTARDGTRQSQP
ncbi:hypothetical protein BD324DRAFT_600886 [Kockovaella imperatae]|uniref:Pentatricopeptide repeat-containing protein-mitochondrial domain-containing protein n=1 Tax=Kockovaella imperatae TaxID=4999 RepID=A0A1Y1UI34_9TREE|nr:hypothetical protein BD324DRAFT_600886 [Kockovaella imperatae]ORX37197.1 hypothetical protein BD324DRAFT_600886 [Kockovaella imperatae]